MNNPLHNTKSMIGALAYFRDSPVKAIVRVMDVVDTKDYTRTKILILAVAYRGDEPPPIESGEFHTVSEINKPEWNQLWTIKKLESEQIDDAIKEIDAHSFYQWKT